MFGVSIDQMLVNDLRRRPHYKGDVPLFLEEVNLITLNSTILKR